MQNNNFAETLASVASEFGVEDTAKHGRGIKPSKRPYFRWTDEQLEQLATLRDEGKSANEIAEALGVSSDKVITKLAAMAARQRTKPEAVREQIKQAEQELNLIVDQGGRVINISISHRVYGRITAEMDIRSRQDVQEFLQALTGGASTVLSTATDGYHYHLVEAATPARLDLIGQALQDAGFLAPLQPWEKEK